MTFVLWLILAVLSWPLAVIALVLYPLVWLLSLPFRLVGLSMNAVFDLLRAMLTAPRGYFGGVGRELVSTRPDRPTATRDAPHKQTAGRGLRALSCGAGVRTVETVNVEIDQIMQHPVMTATPHQTVGHVRDVMAMHHVSALPVVNTHNEPVGIVTAADLLDDHPAGAPISGIMSEPVYTVPRYDGPHIAARIMRNHHLHHVVVTEAKQVVGMISTYDLLRLVEDHRYVAKRPPTPLKNAKGRQ